MVGFFNYLERLRTRPEAQRRRLTWLIAVVGTLLVLAVWFANLKFLLTVAPPVSSGNGAGFTERVQAGWQTLLSRLKG
jgi:hypothetical protein